MTIDYTKLAPEQISPHLSNPKGDLGRAVGEFMARQNEGMTKAAYSLLEIGHGQSVLEIGHGNGALVWMLVTADNGVTYKGLDISETMIEEARAKNASLAASTNRVSFHFGAAEQIPFADETFDRIVSVNCIYFWDIPRALSEIRRVLVPGGRVVTASASPENMKNNKIVNVQYGFRQIELDPDTLRKHHLDAGFASAQIEADVAELKRMDGTSYMRTTYLTIGVK